MKNFSIFTNHSRNFTFFLRCLSSRSRQSLQGYSAIPVWSRKVYRFGKLKVLCGNIGVHIQAASLWKYEEDAVAVSLVSDCEELLSWKGIRECVSGHVTVNDYGLSLVEIQIDPEDVLQNLKTSLLNRTKLLIEIPHLYDLFLNCAYSSPITIEKLENDQINIQTKGNCVLSQLKSRLVTISSDSGNIVGKSSLIGNMHLTTGKTGDISLGKVQGNSIQIKSEEGDVKVDSLYGGDVLISTCAGCVVIGDAHGNIEGKSSSGDIKCGSISGLLKAVTNQGNIEVKLTSGGNVEATSSNGNAVIKLDLDLKCDLELISQTMNIASDFQVSEKSKHVSNGLVTLAGQTLGTGEQYAKVNCRKGNVDLVQERWFVLPET